MQKILIFFLISLSLLTVQIRAASHGNDRLTVEFQQNKSLALNKDTLTAENRLNEAALSNASHHDLQDLMDKVFRFSVAACKSKIACRENMRELLGKR